LTEISVLQLLWIETVLKLSGGLVLCLAPLLVIKALGLPPAASAFWPRVLGALLIGLAAATFIEGAWPQVRALGLAGCIVINLVTAAMISVLATLGAGAPARRGSAVLWALVVLLVVLSLFEIAHV
jgi:hypothetical protein